MNLIKKNSRHFSMIIAAIAMIGLAFSATAQQVELNAAVSKNELVVGERFQLEFTVNGNGKGFTPPNLSDFRLLSGPYQSSSMKLINGRMSSSLSFKYVFVAIKEGEFTIEPAAIKVGNEVLKSKPIKINVSKANASTAPSKAQGKNGNVPKGGDKNLYIKALVNKTSLYKGEQMTLTFKIYFRDDVIQNNQTKVPELKGFWSQDATGKQTTKQEYINGLRYNTHVWRHLILFPQKSGKLVIDPMEMAFLLRKQSKRRPQNPFDQFFGTYEQVEKTVASAPVTINVKPLPAGAPDNFSGAVGSFNLDVSASKTAVKANEGIDLKLVVSGTGNMKLMESPKLNLPSDFEVYDPEVKDNLNYKSSGVTGSISYQYLVIPRHKGSYTIDPVQYTYFDPVKKKYITLTSDAIDIEVEKGDSEGSAQTYGNISKEDVQIIGNDIRFIKKSSEGFSLNNEPFYGTLLFYVLSFIPLLLLIAVFLVRNYYRDLYSDKLRLRSNKATGVAKKRLSGAKKHLDAQAFEKFYEEISKALYGYISDKLNINYAELNKEQIKSTLENNGVSNTVIGGLIEIIETCDMARFAPLSSSASGEFYKKAVEVIKDIENELK